MHCTLNEHMKLCSDKLVKQEDTPRKKCGQMDWAVWTILCTAHDLINHGVYSYTDHNPIFHYQNTHTL